MPAPGRTPANDPGFLALALLLGVSVVHLLTELPARWIFITAPLALLLRWPIANSLRYFLLIALLGAAWAGMQAHARLEKRLDPSRHGEDRWLAGIVANLPEREGSDLRFIFAPHASELERVRVGWYRTNTTVHGGDCLRLKLRLRAPHGMSNPGAFDYEAWLYREGINANSYVRDSEPCDAAMETSLGFSLSRKLLRLRQGAVDAVTAILPGHPMLGLVLGLTVGDASAISDEQWQVLRRTGTTHLVSISGLHVALMAGVVFALARWLWSRNARLCLRLPAQRAAAIAAMLAAIAYSLMAGMSIPTQRSLIMLLVLLAALLLGRETRPSQLLALALIAVLVHDPSAVLFPGFWLSFGAIAWIAYLATGRVGPRARLGTFLWLQLGLGLALAPLALIWFGETSVAGPLANLVMIPLYSLVIPALLLWLLLLPVVPVFATAALQMTAEGLRWSWLGLEAAAHAPHAFVTWPPPSIIAMLLATGGLVLLLAPRGFPARWLGLVMCIPIALPASQAPPAGSVDLALLDVGQGLAAVVRTQGHALLFDAGPASPTGLDTGEAIVAPFLRSSGVNSLDVLVISHGDLDHRGGVDAVRRELAVVREIGTRGHPPCRRGQRWRWDGVDFEILHPGPEEQRSDNDGSCVLRVTTGDHSLLLPGDIERAAEASLVAEQVSNLRADLVVVPHHGSRTSSTDAFVAAVAPRHALVSAGWRNRWGFPKADVVTRYEQAGAVVVTTGDSGAILVRMSGANGIERLQRWREESRRFWTLR